MTTILHFAKASGAGNDFVLLEDLQDQLTADRASLARALCDRHFGVGSDGLLILASSTVADFRMEYYNADGSQGGMCGNGGRCIALYAYLRKIARERMSFEAVDHLYTAEVKPDRINLRMKDPSAIELDIALPMAGSTLVGHFIDTGSPHLVVFTDALATVDVMGLGRMLRDHERFTPGGTNVNFVEVRGGDRIQVRTYERGVEAETLACGTGSVASAIVSAVCKGILSPVTVGVRSGEQLHVEFSHEENKFRDVYLEGTASIVCVGELVYDLERKRVLSFPIQKLPRGTL